jgi:murein L,D-transpeptidase YcbB/YkuD
LEEALFMRSTLSLRLRTTVWCAAAFVTAIACRDSGAGARPPAERNVPPSQAAAGGVQSAAPGAVLALVESKRHPWLKWAEFPHLQPALRDVYAAEPDGLFWVEGGRPVATLQAAVEALAQAGTHGLNPDDYDAPAMAERLARVTSAPVPSADVAAFDLAVSITVARLLSAVHEGRIDPKTVGFQYDVTPRRLDVAQALRSAREQGAGTALREVSPQFPVYTRLMDALAKYRALAAAGEPPAVPLLAGARKKVEPGSAWDGVPALAERLRVLGDLAGPAPAGGSAPATYGGAMVDAVKRFQDRHALEADGVIGASTIAALNVPLAKLVRQIELALERERWLPDTRNRPLLFVNVPMFKLWAYDPERPDDPLRMNVVVGKALGHATPLFVEQMEYVVFSPFWNPPSSILRSEIVPNARRDAGYLARQNMEIVAGGGADAPSLPVTATNLDNVLKGKLFIRQKPGPRNSLGQAKFIFPNADNVYMHGTPAQQLFSRARRDFSHGCIRLEDPPRLAEWVLRTQPEWTRARIDAAMSAGTPAQVNLKETLTVLIFYDTVYVDSNGVVHVADDYYGHDAKLDEALRKGYPYARAGR